jgi:hypothetical protein
MLADGLKGITRHLCSPADAGHLLDVDHRWGVKPLKTIALRLPLERCGRPSGLGGAM